MYKRILAQNSKLRGRYLQNKKALAVQLSENQSAKSYPSGLKGAVIGLCKKGDTTVYLFLLNNILQDIDDV